MTIYGYLRVSTIEQVSDGNSIVTQRSQIEGYCQMRGFTTVPTIYAENGVSGSIPFADRPVGAVLLSILKAGDILIATKLDRAFRNAGDALRTLEFIKETGAELHLLDLGGDVVGGTIAKLMFTILSAVAEAERDRLRERIREVKAHMKEAGLHHGGPRPYGFKVVNKRLVPIPDEQAWVRRIRELRSDGLGTFMITKRLRDEGGPSFQATQVKRILDRTGMMAA